MLGLAWLAWLWAAPRMGTARRPLCRPGRAHFHRAVSLHPLHHSRGGSSPFSAHRALRLITGLESNRPNALLLDVGLRGAGSAHQGPHRARLLLSAPPFPTCCSPANGAAGARSSPSPASCSSAIAAPWHILCGLANPDQGHPIGNHPTIGNVHGFWYFYFVNEHFLRFFGQRYPHDYNKLPFAWYWLLHLVWLFPWSLFLPALVAVAWKTRHHWLQHLRHDAGQTVDFYLDHAAAKMWPAMSSPQVPRAHRLAAEPLLRLDLLFFSISTNQEYYTFPVWPPLFILIAGVLAGIEEKRGLDGTPDEGPNSSSSAALDALAHRRASRLCRRRRAGAAASPGACGTRAICPSSPTSAPCSRTAAWRLHPLHVALLRSHRRILCRAPPARRAGRRRSAHRSGHRLAAAPQGKTPRRHRQRGPHLGGLPHRRAHRLRPLRSHARLQATSPTPSSKKARPPTPSSSTASSPTPHRSSFTRTSSSRASRRFLVLPRCGQHGEGTPLLWGSCYPDAPNIFLSEDQLSKVWGTGERKWLFAQDINQQKAESLLAGRLYPVQSIADKASGPIGR
jgi:hypothetical protein